MTERLHERTGEPSIRATIAAVWNRKLLIGGVALLLTVASMILSLIMPRAYVAKTTLLPPISSSSNVMGLPGMEASLGLLGLRDESLSTAKLFQQILTSRTVMAEVIRKQGLIDWYRLTKRPEREAYETAIQLLRGGSSVRITDADLIEISVRFATSWFAGGEADERTRQLAASVANTFVEELDLVNREKSLSRAKQTRLYLQHQLEENNEAIRELSESLAVFQRSHGAVALDAQTKALIETAAELKGRLLAKEVELGVAEQTMTVENPVITQLQSEISNLRKGLASLQTSPGTGSGGRSDARVDIPASEIPELQSQLAEFERELKARLLLESYLNQQYHQARIQEARDTPTVQVLDPAIPPVERFSPKRKLMAVGGLLSGLILGLLAAAVLEWLRVSWPGGAARQSR